MHTYIGNSMQVGQQPDLQHFAVASLMVEADTIAQEDGQCAAVALFGLSLRLNVPLQTNSFVCCHCSVLC